jgi:hypothetical protein
MQTVLRNLIVTALFSVAPVCAQVQAISQFVDGGDWSSTLVATNTTTSDTVASLMFNMDTAGGATEPWSPPFLEGGNTQALVIPAGSSVFLHTPGTAAAVSQGWAQLVGQGVVGYVIYSHAPKGQARQDATAPAVTPASRILAPFDNTNGLVTAFAVVNPNPIPLSLSVNIKTTGGTVTTDPVPNLPQQGHVAFLMPNQFPETAGQAGLAEFYSNSGNFTIIALRANPTGAFTALPVYTETGAPVISGAGGNAGGGNGGAGDIVDAAFSIGIINLTSAQGSQTMDIVGGAISQFTPANWNAPFSGTKYGPCVVYKTTYSSNASPNGAVADLDAGSSLGLSGAGLVPGTLVPSFNSPIGPVYSATFPAGTFQPGSTYDLSSKGGSRVKAFDVKATLPANFTIKNWAAINSLDRSKSLTLNWTGAQGDELLISASSLLLGANIQGVFIGCAVAGSAGTLTIPADAMANLLQVPAGSTTATGSLGVQAVNGVNGNYSPVSNNSTSFLPNLIPSGKANYGAFAPYIGYQKSVGID